MNKVRNFNKIFYISLFVFAFILSSCKSELEGPIYTPKNSDVTFQFASVKQVLDGKAMVFKVTRGIADTELTLPITLRDNSGLYSLETQTLLFPIGEYEKELKVNYDFNKVEPGVNYNFVLSFATKDKALAGVNRMQVDCKLDHGVSFEKKSINVQLDGKDLTLKLTREVAKKSLKVPISIIDKKGVFSLENSYAIFDKTSKETTIKLKYNSKNVVHGVNNTTTLTFDESYTSKLGINSINISSLLPNIDGKFSVIGDITVKDDFYEGYNNVKYILMRHKDDPDYYRVVNLFGSNLDFEFRIEYDTKTKRFVTNILAPEKSYMYDMFMVPDYFANFKTVDEIFNEEENFDYGNLYIAILIDKNYCKVDNLADDRGTIKVGTVLSFERVMYYAIVRDMRGVFNGKQWQTIKLEVTNLK